MKPSYISIQSSCLIFILVLLTWPATVTAATPSELLRQTMADIALLNGQMAQRKADADGIHSALSMRLKEIETEVQRELRQRGIETHHQALEDPRVGYDLMLMAEIQAYINRYKQKIGYYRVACNRLSYLYQQADDDLKIVSTLPGMKVDALISQAEEILSAYLPDAQTIVIQPGTLTIDPPKEVWKALKAGK